MNETITKEFERVIALVRAEQMSLTDFIGEFQKLLEKTENLASKVEEQRLKLESRDKTITDLKTELDYAQKQLVPQDDLAAACLELEKDKVYHEKNVFAFNCHRDYLIRENGMLREILSSLLARKEINERFFVEHVTPPGYTNSQGTWITPQPVPIQRHDKTEHVYKPNLPEPKL